PVRIGFADAREGAPLAYTHRVETTEVHTVDRMHALVHAAGVPIIEDLRLHAPEGPKMPRGVIAVAPTSRWASKRWPIDRFASVVEALVDSSAVAIVGAGGERAQCAPLLERFQEDDRVLDLVGRTSIGDLMRLVEGASLVLANDSAALHMAVGFDRPIVALYGPTDVTRVGPWRREADVVQHLEAGDDLRHKRDEQVSLMHRIGVDEVIERCRRALSHSPARTPS
ncbi:MAG: glycosyltransferase family 9 protein, partial [Phycisphaerales bacterium]|nr:glycosyltransferase family 9 protein [Phycisphaerales bacterium]